MDAIVNGEGGSASAVSHAISRFASELEPSKKSNGWSQPAEILIETKGKNAMTRAEADTTNGATPEGCKGKDSQTTRLRPRSQRNGEGFHRISKFKVFTFVYICIDSPFNCVDDLVSIRSLPGFHISRGSSFLARRYISTLHTLLLADSYNKHYNPLPALALCLCDEKKFPYKGRRRDRQDTQLTIGAQQTAKATS